MWFVFSALAGLLYTGEGLLQRYFLRKQKDAWAFSFFYSLVGTIVSFPFMLASPVLPTSIGPWDVYKLKAQAAKEGLPYQTLLHPFCISQRQIPREKRLKNYIERSSNAQML